MSWNSRSGPRGWVTATAADAGSPGSVGPKVPVNVSGQVVFQVLPGTSSFTAWDGTAYSKTPMGMSWPPA